MQIFLIQLFLWSDILILYNYRSIIKLILNTPLNHLFYIFHFSIKLLLYSLHPTTPQIPITSYTEPPTFNLLDRPPNKHQHGYKLSACLEYLSIVTGGAYSRDKLVRLVILNGWLESDTREGLGHQGHEGCWLSSSLTRLTEKRQLKHSTSAATDSAVAHARPVQRIE